MNQPSRMSFVAWMAKHPVRPFLPRAVRVRLMSHGVRAYLEHHARNFGAVASPRLAITRVVDGIDWRNGVSLPFGWTSRRVLDRDARVVGPWWYLGVRAWLGEARWWIQHFAVRIGALQLREEGGFFSEGRWWPTCPRFSDE